MLRYTKSNNKLPLFEKVEYFNAYSYFEIDFSEIKNSLVTEKLRCCGWGCFLY